MPLVFDILMAIVCVFYAYVFFQLRREEKDPGWRRRKLKREIVAFRQAREAKTTGWKLLIRCPMPPRRHRRAASQQRGQHVQGISLRGALRRKCVAPALRMERFQPFGGETMRDLLFVAVSIVFFLVSLAYVRGCDRLK